MGKINRRKSLEYVDVTGEDILISIKEQGRSTSVFVLTKDGISRLEEMNLSIKDFFFFKRKNFLSRIYKSSFFSGQPGYQKMSEHWMRE